MLQHRPGLFFVLSLAVTLLPEATLHGQEKEPGHGSTTCMVLADLNGDGKLDVVLGRYALPNQVFVADGSGRFREARSQSMAALEDKTRALALGDLDGDGQLDLLVGNSRGQNRLFLGQGQGKGMFVDRTKGLLPAGDSVTTAMALADVDADGDLDLFVANYEGSDRLLLNDGKGKLQMADAARFPRDQAKTTSLAVGDLDLDGDLDVIFGSDRSSAKSGGGQTRLYLNDGKGTFVDATASRMPKDRSNTSYLLLGNLDQQELPDLIIGNPGSKGGKGGKDKLYLNKGSGNFAKAPGNSIPKGLTRAEAAQLGDLDGDGDLDWLLATDKATLLLRFNDGKGKFKKARRQKVPAVGATIAAMALGDVDGDGDGDLVLATKEALRIYHNDGKGGYKLDEKADLFLTYEEVAELERLEAIQNKYGITIPDARTAGKGRYRLRQDKRKQQVPADVAKAIAKGLSWLSKHQDQDGRWDCDAFMKHDPPDAPCKGKGKPQHDVGITSLVLLAFLADGNTMFRGRYHENVVSGMTWLLRQQKRDGMFARRSTVSYAYDHCIATIAMIEGYGLSGDRRLEQSAKQALKCLEFHRNKDSVWSYHAGDKARNTSITAWAMLACLAAQDFGLEVNTKSLETGAAFLEELTDPESGSCGYYERGGISSERHTIERHKAFPPTSVETMTAAALLVRIRLGQKPDANEVLGLAAQTIAGKPPSGEDGTTDLYYWYFATQALYQMGGEPYKTWLPALRAQILSKQASEGSAAGSFDHQGAWFDEGGRVYSTAMAVLCLQTPYRYVRLLAE